MVPTVVSSAHYEPFEPDEPVGAGARDFAAAFSSASATHSSSLGLSSVFSSMFYHIIFKKKRIDTI